MTDELREELLKFEAAVQAAKPILGRYNDEVDATPHLKTLLVLGFMSQVIEHHEEMLVLITEGMTSSAFALARSIFEGMYRGLWIDRAATEAEIEHFIKKDKIQISISTMAKEIDKAYGSGNSFDDLKKREWNALNSYTHNGMLQLGRRFTERELAYTDAQRAEIMSAVTKCVLMLIALFLSRRGFVHECSEVEKLISSCGPMSEGRQLSG